MEEQGTMAAERLAVYNNLVGIRNKLAQVKKEGRRHTMEDLRKYQQMLDSIDCSRDRLGICTSTSMESPGQAVFMEALDDAYDLLEQLVSTASALNSEMSQIYSTLCGIQRKLAKMKQSKTCSVEDLRHYQQMLNSIDSKRVDGVFGGSPESGVPTGQALCSDALAQCYELVHELLPVAQDFNPEIEKTVNSLLTIKEKLLVMKADNVPHVLSHLHPFQVELDEIDKSRQEGIFGGSLKSAKIPAGQALCADLLNECYQLLTELQASSLDAAQAPTV